VAVEKWLTIKLFLASAAQEGHRVAATQAATDLAACRATITAQSVELEELRRCVHQLTVERGHLQERVAALMVERDVAAARCVDITWECNRAQIDAENMCHRREETVAKLVRAR
jgi:hypothetical protein